MALNKYDVNTGFHSFRKPRRYAVQETWPSGSYCVVITNVPTRKLADEIAIALTVAHERGYEKGRSGGTR